MLAIDFGTTNTSGVIIDKHYHANINYDKGIYCDDKYDCINVPSVIYYDSGKFIFGINALNYKYSSSGDYIYELKRLLGKSDNSELDNYTYKVVYNGNKINVIMKDGKIFCIEELIGLFLQYVKNKLDPEGLYNKVIASIPANFNDIQRKSLIAAYEIANMVCIKLINEPTATAMFYKANKSMIIIDIGGGTTDISYVEPNDGVYNVIAVDGCQYFGGKNIDNMLYCLLNDVNNQCDDNQLIKYIELLKIKLINNGYIEYNGNTVTVNDLNNIIHKNMDIFLEPLLNILTIANDNYNAIYLTGPTTLIPIINNNIMKYANPESNKIVYHNNNSVLLGLAEYCLSLLSSNDIVLIDITSFNLGIETIDGNLSVVIPKYTSIPFKFTKLYKVKDNEKNEVDINIYEGNKGVAKDNYLLGAFKFTFGGNIKNNDVYSPMIYISFEISTNGILIINACEKSKGENAIYKINTINKLLSDDDINRMKESHKQYEIVVSMYDNFYNLLDIIASKIYFNQPIFDKYRDIIMNNNNFIRRDLEINNDTIKLLEKIVYELNV